MKLKHYLFSAIFSILYCNISSAQLAVPFTQRLAGGSIKIKGDLMFVGNQITNTTDNIPGHTTNDPNVSYTGTDNNNGHAFGYVDVDGDPATFSSSTADLSITGTCRKIRYAGLYWTATYPFEVSGPGGNGTSSNYTGSPRMNDWNNVKFKLPGGTYIDLTADTAADPVGQEDDIIFDGYNAANPNNSFYAAPYVCYKNVTSLLQSLVNPNGTYTVANVRAARGIRPDGISSGWSLVVIYEDPALPSKYISVFDGYANINGANVDFNVNGFQTLPPPLPVRARLGVSTLEGDYSITGDNLRFKANSVGGFTTITNGLNPNNNFLNGSITTNNVMILTRNPASTNTLGFDLDLVGINNPGNAVLPNNETGGTIRLTTSGDAYGTYLTTFDVEIIEPKVILTKTVQNTAGVDIGNNDVNLCQDLQYVIGYQNIGNDDAQNFTIRDVLPINVTFNPATDLTLPPGVTYTFTAPRTLVFTIPNNQVNIGDPRQEIRIRVKVVCTCDSLDDACSNVIQNQAFATYQGVLNTDQITDDPSLSTYTICNLGTPSPTNFLVGLDACNFTHTVEICGNNPITLTAANGYQSYVWNTTNGHIVSGANSQTVTVDQPGTYTVNDNINTSPCKSIVETYIVTPFTGGVLTNPVIPYVNPPYLGQVVICPNDGKPLPYIFLCGAGDTRLIQTSIAGATSIEWQQLNTASCAAVTNPNCANENPACTWNTIATGPNYTATTAGEFRIKINFPNGCSRIFYFNVYQNLLNPSYTSTDIICNTQGSITVTNVPAGYQYQLINAVTSAVVFSWQTSNIFTPLPAGVYTVQIRQTGVTGGCIFTLPNIGIRARNFTVTYSILQQPLCTGDKGSISISANDVRPQYTFSLSPGGFTSGPIASNNYVFSNLNPGTYTYTVTTQDGCNATGTFTIITPPTITLTLALTKPLSCTDGEITANVVGGTSPYNYVITPPAPGTVYNQSSNIITAPTAGTYSVTVYDFNNCPATSSITINQVQQPVFTISHTNIACSNSGNLGTITVNVTNPNGNSIRYSIDGGLNWQVSNVFTGLAPGTYNVVVEYTTGTAVCTTAPQAVTITIPSPIVGTATLTSPYTCTTNGVITFSGVSGGTGSYTYSIGGAFQVSNVFSGLTNGTYVPVIKDAAGCTLTLPSIVIAPLTPPTDITFAATALSCPANTSNVTLTVTGGALPLNYQIVLGPGAPIPAAPQAGNVFNNLPPGTYTFEVTDAKNCKYRESFTINPLPIVSVTTNVINNVKCFGTSTGSLSFTVSNFGASYNYTTSPNIGSGSGIITPTTTINNVPAGTYTITVTNTTTNCSGTATVTITQPVSALASTIVTSPVTCLANGSVTINATGGWGGYTYTILPVAGTHAGNIFSNLPAGSYTVTTTDSGGCSVTNNFTLVAPTPPTATISAASDFCYDATNGATLIVTASGGVGPYQYSINGGAFQSSNTFGPLTPGGHTIVVKDSYGCTVTLPVQTIKPQLSLTTTLTKDLDCTASPNAVITGTISAGSGYAPYTCTVNGVPTPVVGNIITYTATAAGTYTFVVTDSKGCTATSVITINPLVPVSAVNTTVVNNKCFGDTAGSVTITPSGGVGPYTIQWNGVGPFTSQTTYSGLASGTYNYIVRDSKSCTFNGTVTITSPTQIAYTAVINPIQCTATGYSLGSICVQGLTGGVPPYTYSLTDLTGGTGTINHVEPAGANYCFPNVDFGMYDLTVTDANGCSIVKSSLVVTNPPNDLTFVITPTIPSCAAGATVSVTVVGLPSSTYQFGIMNCSPAAGYVCLPNTWNVPSNPPFTHVFSGLTPGVVYTFVVRDTATGCYYFETMTAPTPTNSTIVPTLIPHNVTCRNANNGTVSGSLTGAGAGCTSVSYVINYASSGLPVVPAISGTLTGPGFNFTNLGPLTPGTYTIYFRELNGANAGCGVTSNVFTIAQSAVDLAFTTTQTNANCNAGGQVNLTISGGTTPYSYSVDAGAYVTLSTPPFTITGLTPGAHTINIKDANDCIKSTSVTIIMDSTPSISPTLNDACAAQGAYIISVPIPVGGVGPFTYAIDSPTFTSMTAPFTITGLSSGSHTIIVKDRNGCTDTKTINILAPLVASAAFTTQPTCNNPNGQITVTASGGSGTYSYSITPNAGILLAGNVFSNVAAGSYNITVTDTTTGCTTNVPVSIALPDPVTFTLASTAPTCTTTTDGTITVTLGAGNNNPNYTYQITAPIAVGPQTSNVFTGLSATIAGTTYTIQVNSGRGCSSSQTITINAPAAVNATASLPTPVFTCNASNTLNQTTLTITGFGGTGTYTYSINNVNYFTTNTFNITATAASQTITYYVKDSNGCLFSNTIVVPGYTPLNASFSATTLTCTTNGVYTITASGGSGSYTYSTLPTGAPNVIAGPLLNQFTITAPGTYYFRVTDATTGCYYDLPAYIIAPFNTIDVVATAITPVTCFGDTNGALSINVTGYIGAYNYQVFDATTGLPITALLSGNTTVNPRSITGLPAGNYTITVTETATPFCTKVSNVVTIAGPATALTVSASETANVTCTNNQGVITAIASGGWTGSYSYTLTPGAITNTTGVFTGLSGTIAGTTYTVTVTDAGGCIRTATVTLTTPAPISFTATAAAPMVACEGDTTSISISYPTGGQGSNYAYTMQSSNPVPTGSISGPFTPMVGPGPTIVTGLPAGAYIITITDGYNCSATRNVVISQPTKVGASLAMTTSPTCSAPTVLTLSANGGTPPYSYSPTIAGPYIGSFNPSTTISIAANTPSATYHYYVKDANGCIAPVSNDVLVTPPSPLTINALSHTNVLCGGSATGTITASATGGLLNYVYSLYNVAVGGAPIAATQPSPGYFTGLTGSVAGTTYYVEVTSTGGCTSPRVPVVITENAPLIVTATPQGAKCNGGKDGLIHLTVAGGTGTIQYAISPTLSQFITIPTPAGYDILNLPAGSYTVIVQDQNGCYQQFPNIVVTEPTPIGFNITNVVNEKCAEQDLASFDITNITGGTAPYKVTYTVTYPNGTTGGPGISGAIQLAAGITSYQFINLNGGTYDIIVIDANGCITDKEQIIGSGDLYTPEAVVSYPCVNNVPAVQIEVLNTTTPADPAFPSGYTFVLQIGTNTYTQTGNNIFTSANYSQLLTAGSHSITVTSPKGCIKPATPNPIVVTPLTPLSLTLSQGGLNTILATATGGTGVYVDYTFNGVSNGNVNTYVYSQSGTYTVVVTDSSGCTATATKPFTFIPIFIPDVFTPNGDGNHDGWAPQNTSNYKNLVTIIYDRYGREVARLNEGEKWDGKYEGKELPSGDYWYVLRVDERNAEEFVGHFTLYR